MAITLLAELFTMTDIDAPVERVWQVLTEFRRYPEWNPFIRSIEGALEWSAQLAVLLQPEGGRPMRYRPRVVTVRPPRELRWVIRPLIPGFLNGEHRFVVERLGDDRSRLIHEKRVRGLLVPFLRLGMETPIKKGFEAMSVALKRTAEGAG